MTGVEILASNEIVVESAWNWLWCGIVGGAVFGCILLAGILLCIKYSDWAMLPVLVFLGLFGGALCGSAVGATYSTPTKYETRYKVTISDDILMNDFLERYEIIDQEGKIYTVREINENTI